MNVSERMAGAMRRSGVAVPEGDELPTGAQLVERLYDPVARLPELEGRIRMGAEVQAVGRERLLKHEEIGTRERGEHPFRLLLTDSDGEEIVESADVVVDCTGTYGNPNALGDGGIPAPGERALADRIVRLLPDFPAEREAWAGRTILLTGAGHSAQTAAKQLAEFARDADGTRVIWAVRAQEPTWGGVEDDPLPERARLNSVADELARGASPAVQLRRGTVTDALRGEGGQVAVTLRNGMTEEVVVDRVLGLNGGVGDHTIYRQLQVHECYATSGPIKLAAALLGASGGDCLARESHGAETLVNPEPGFFLLGAKSYGRNSQFLLRVGWDQVDDVLGLLEAR
ncbi:hypothetical protein BH20ACT18_BH20ACT18_03970 [soil metagenome]